MNYLRPELLDKLAAEYVLGTLRGLARKRFERLLAEQATARLHVKEWETRLASLAVAIPEAEPPRRVWRAIESRIEAERARQPRPGAPARPAGSGFWRGLALFMSGVAALLMVYLGVAPRPAPGPAKSYIVVLNSDRMKPVMMAEADAASSEIRVRVLATQAIGSDKSLELWGLPKGGKPRSYGLIPASGIVRLRFDKPIEQVLSDIAALAVSLEPQGGSPTGQPTGPVLYTGEVIRPI